MNLRESKEGCMGRMRGKRPIIQLYSKITNNNNNKQYNRYSSLFCVQPCFDCPNTLYGPIMSMYFYFSVFIHKHGRLSGGRILFCCYRLHRKAEQLNPMFKGNSKTTYTGRAVRELSKPGFESSKMEITNSFNKKKRRICEVLN